MLYARNKQLRYVIPIQRRSTPLMQVGNSGHYGVIDFFHGPGNKIGSNQLQQTEYLQIFPENR